MADGLSEEKKPIFPASAAVGGQSKFKTWIDSIPTRYVFTLLGFFGMMNVYAMRVNLSVAMVAMVGTSSHSNVSSECGHSGSGEPTDSTSPSEGEFAWDEQTQGIILGSFFWGYIVTQLPGGRVAEMFSGKWLFGFGVLCTAVFTLLTPLAARAGIGYLIAARILEGLGEGVTFPAMHVMLSKWCLPYERSKLSTFVYTGCQVGTVLAMPLTGILCENENAGWPSVFYFFGCLGIVWFIFWAIFAYDSPMKHPRISADERNCFIEHMGYAGYCPPAKREVFPWKHVLSSPAVWAIVVAHFGQNWGFYTLLTEMPTYMKNILHYDIKKNSFLSALPYLGMWIFGLVCSCVADYLRSNGIASTSAVRKVANFVGVVGPAAGLIGITLIGCSNTWNLLFLVLAVTLNGAVYAGFQCNHIDIAPKFAGTLIGISNSVATIPGIAAPYVVGILTVNQQTLHQWYIVFYIAAAIYTFVGLFFVLFSSGEEQLWYKYTVDDEEEFLKDSSCVHSDKEE